MARVWWGFVSRALGVVFAVRCAEVDNPCGSREPVASRQLLIKVRRRGRVVQIRAALSGCCIGVIARSADGLRISKRQ